MGLIVLLLYLVITTTVYNHGHKDNKHSHDHDHLYILESNDNQIYYSLLSVFFISVLPIFILIIISFFISKNGDIGKSSILKSLVAFGCGSLMGDSFLHLIPHSFEEINDSRSVSFSIIIGLVSFFIIEQITSILQHNTRDKKTKQSSQNDHQHHQNVQLILNILCDSFHNFIDGLAIASSYKSGYSLGIATTISVFFHEIPHEISDYAIILKCGKSKAKAILYQFITAIASLIGVCFCFYFSESHKMTQLLTPFTAGGFLYISLVSLMPEILKSTQSVKQSLNQMFFLIVGLIVMSLIDH